MRANKQSLSINIYYLILTISLTRLPCYTYFNIVTNDAPKLPYYQCLRGLAKKKKDKSAGFSGSK